MKLFKSNEEDKTARQSGSNLGRAPVYSYHSVRDSRINEDRAIQTERSVHIKGQPSTTQLVIKRVTLVLILGVLLFGLWLKPDPQVTIISQEGTIRRDEATYRAGVKQIWTKRLLNQSKLTMQADKLSKEIELLYPEIDSASIELPLLGRISNIVITPGRPILLLVTQGGAFYVAEDGRTMARSDQVQAYSLGSIPTVRDDSGIVPEAGRPALPFKQVQTVITILELCNQAKIELESVVLPPVPNEVALVVKGTKYNVKLSLSEDPRQGIGALIAIREKFAEENITPSVYVDLRVPDKAFYK